MSVDELNRTAIGALNDVGPVTMVNLVKLRDRSSDGNGSGWDAYLRYSAETMPMIKARGGTVLWSGRADAVALGDPAQSDWDFVVLVRYPSRAAFLDMMTSSEYETQANPHRVNGTASHVIIATTESFSKFKG
jgi:uncharacterized protein (DUF1330 family)